MSVSRRRRFHLAFANFFGVLGYIAILLQLLVVVIAYFDGFKALVELVAPERTADVQPVVVSAEPLGPPPLEMIVFTSVITVVMVVVTIYAVIRLPGAIARAGNKTVKTAAEHAAPLVLKVQKKKDTPARRKRLSARLIAVGKAVLIALPLGATALSPVVTTPSLDYRITLVLGVFFAVVGILAFGVQYTLAHFLKLDRTTLR